MNKNRKIIFSDAREKIKQIKNKKFNVGDCYVKEYKDFYSYSKIIDIDEKHRFNQLVFYVSKKNNYLVSCIDLRNHSYISFNKQKMEQLENDIKYSGMIKISNNEFTKVLESIFKNIPDTINIICKKHTSIKYKSFRVGLCYKEDHSEYTTYIKLIGIDKTSNSIYYACFNIPINVEFNDNLTKKLIFNFSQDSLSEFEYNIKYGTAEKIVYSEFENALGILFTDISKINSS